MPIPMTPRLCYCPWVQVDGVKSYDEDQIALVVPDKSKFVEQIPVILGTLTISQVVNIMKEREIDALGQCQGGISTISMQSNDHGGG